MVINYQALNQLVVKDCFPLPLHEELIDKLKERSFSPKWTSIPDTIKGEWLQMILKK
jgi:hypothetical protein